MWIVTSASDCCSDCMSVLTATNSTPATPASIMRLTALTPAPPTPTTRICGEPGRSGADHGFSPYDGAGASRDGGVGAGTCVRRGSPLSSRFSGRSELNALRSRSCGVGTRRSVSASVPSAARDGCG